MEKIEFELWGLSLLEPLSTVMNWVMAAQCGRFYFKLKNTNHEFQKKWAWFFLAYFISLIFGGLGHLFFNYFEMIGKIPGWSIAVLGTAAAELAMIHDLEDEKKKQTLTTVIRSKLFATLVLLFIDPSFKWVMVQTAGLFLFIGIISINRFKKGLKAYRYFLIGVFCLLLMAPINMLGLDIHKSWFTRDDLAHVLMIVAFWKFYQGTVAVVGKSAQD